METAVNPSYASAHETRRSNAPLIKQLGLASYRLFPISRPFQLLYSYSFGVNPVDEVRPAH